MNKIQIYALSVVKSHFVNLRGVIMCPIKINEKRDVRFQLKKRSKNVGFARESLYDIIF